MTINEGRLAHVIVNNILSANSNAYDHIAIKYNWPVMMTYTFIYRLYMGGVVINPLINT